MLAQLDADYIRTRPRKALTRLVSYALFEGRPVTTRGQWINPLVFAHFAIEKRLPQLKPVRRPIFIVGTGRSGTTILGKILSLHPEVGFLNEPKALWHAVYPHEDVIGSYDRGAAAYRLGGADATPPVAAAAHRLFGAYLWATRTTRVLDKYPEHVFRIPFLRALFPDAQFLWIVRNGWDTIRSIDRWSDRLGTTEGDEKHNWWGVDDRKWHLFVDQVAATHDALRGRQRDLRALDRHVDRAALEWALTVEEGRQHEATDTPVHRVRYETLTRAPAETLRRLQRAVHLPVDSAVLQYGQRVLTTSTPKPPVALDDRVRPVFEEAMSTLGYA